MAEKANYPESNPAAAASALLPAAALRALAEAQERYRAAAPSRLPVEVGGRGGRDPVRYGDWEIKGRAIDF